MRFVDVPAPSPRPESDQTPARSEDTRAVLSSDTPPTLSPRAQASSPDPPAASSVRVPFPEGTHRSRRPGPLRRALRKAWSTLTWTLSTWLHHRSRAALLAPAVAPAANAASPEPVYVTFHHG